MSRYKCFPRRRDENYLAESPLSSCASRPKPSVCHEFTVKIQVHADGFRRAYDVLAIANILATVNVFATASGTAKPEIDIGIE